MSDEKLTDLDLATSLAETDAIYIVTGLPDNPVSERTTRGALTGWPQTASELLDNIWPTNIKYLPGSANRYGADPTGLVDSAPAFQTAVASNYEVTAVGGNYLMSSTVVISKPKILDFGLSTQTGFDGGNGQPAYDIGEQVRFMLVTDINVFEIQVGWVKGRGGCFDLQGVAAPTKAVFYYPAVSNGRSSGGVGDYAGWGGGWTNFTVLGNLGALPTGTGADAIFFDFANQSVNNAYWTTLKFQGQISGANRAFYANAKNGAITQWSNSISLDLGVNSCKQSVVNETVNWMEVKIVHQSDNIFGTQLLADAQPSVYFRNSTANTFDCVFWDFGTGLQGSTYANEFDYDVLDSSDRNLSFKEPISDHAIQFEATFFQSSVGYTDRRTSSNQLNDISHVVNTTSRKTEGFCVFNENTNVPVWATGATAGSVWVDATGSTINTPV